MRFALKLVLLLVAAAAVAQPNGEYRAFWVDTFNTPLATHDDVLAVVRNAKAANANTILAQVRRRGDAWYLNGIEPLPELTPPIAPGYDPLRDLIAEAHAASLEVHAFVIIGAIWNRDPAIAPPADPRHIFNRHGGFDPISKTILPGPENWLTRTLLADTTPASSSISYQGHRFGGDFWIDLGHPAAASYTLDVVMQLVRNYDIDGLHLDRIRYPELSISGQSPATGASIGYNPTSVARFQKRYNIDPTAPPPAANDARWSQWRRDQVTNFVRRVYLNVLAEKPDVVVSAALIATGGGPTTESSWPTTEPYWRVYQDWRAWQEEGILDLAIPMIYKREHVASQAAQFAEWAEWVKNHQYNRASAIGIGAFINAIEGSLQQTRRALAASAGVAYFSMANPDTAVSPNPWSIPQGQSTPARGFDEFAAALTTGRSRNAAVLYERPELRPVFADPANVPALPWKVSPPAGHLMGFARRPDGTPLDAATVRVTHTVSGESRTTITDGSGFFGAVDLEPGQYLIDVELGSDKHLLGNVTVAAGEVSRVAAAQRRRIVRR